MISSFFGLGDVGDLFCHVNPFAGASGDFFAGKEEVLEDSLFGYEGGVEFFFGVFFFGVSGNALAGAVEVADEFGSLGDFTDLFFVVFVGVLGVEPKGCDVGVLVSVAYRHEVCHDALLQVEGGAAAFCAK